MKTYVFLTKRITNIGGAEQYIYNKSLYLKSQGWRVLIFSGRYGEILIDEFKQYEKYIYPALRYSPSCYSEKEITKTVKEICDTVGDCGGDECIIESESTIRSLWAELVAQKLGCRHFAFPVQESFDSTEDIKAYFRFKYDRHELAGITEESINKMLGDETAHRRDDTKFSAYCNNVIEECPDRISALLNPDADYTIGSLGRLDKPCVLPILNGIKRFTDEHPRDFFNIVLIGGQGNKKKTAAIKAVFSGVENVKLVMTGNMYPVPKTLVEKIDVFVSAAGSATATYMYGKETVKVNPNTGEVIGIPGLDFDVKKKSFNNVDKGMTIEGCLKRVLLDKVDIEYSYSLDSSYYTTMYKEFDRQIEIARGVSELEYYDPDKIKRMIPGKRAGKAFKLIGALGKAVGSKALSKILDLAGVE